MQRNATYVLGFAAVVSVVCAVFVSTVSVALKDLQAANASAYRQQNVLIAAGLAEADEKLSAADLEERSRAVETLAIDLATGALAPEIDVLAFDQRRAAADPASSRAVEPNAAQVRRVPNNAVVYEVRDVGGDPELVILPIEGKGLWSTLYGFIAIEGDLRTIRGITFYEHKETPGLGGEVDNVRWKSRWAGRIAFDDGNEVAITVVKGAAGPVDEAPHEVDGLSGATITSRGVTELVRFWLGNQGFGPYLDRLRGETS